MVHEISSTSYSPLDSQDIHATDSPPNETASLATHDIAASAGIRNTNRSIGYVYPNQRRRFSAAATPFLNEDHDGVPAGRGSRNPLIKSRSIEVGMLSKLDGQVLHFINGEIQKPPHTKSHADRIIFNVSGKRFETTFECLNGFPDTLLGTEEDRKKFYDPVRDEYFLNRNQVAFDSVLYYYQSDGEIYRPANIPEKVFSREIEYYRLFPSKPAESIATSTIRQNGFWKRFQLLLWLFLEKPQSSSGARIWASLNIIIILISVCNLISESMPVYRHNPEAERIFFSVDACCVSYFTIDILLRFSSSPSKRKFLKEVLNWFDMLAVLPFYVELLLGENSGTDGMMALRVLRLFRITRVLKLIRHSQQMMLMLLVLRNCFSELGILFCTWLMGALVFGTIMHYIEVDADSGFDSVLYACWWAAVTMTTVGYGDMTPQTNIGKAFGSMILFISMIYIALPMTLIVSKFNTALEDWKQQERTQIYYKKKANEEQSQSNADQENEQAVQEA
ncbi:shaker-related potassium channel tsha2-like isoform X1 [Bolinopsis microptera]|uniref:shaker-related potassium channel tsha2-like isoform X1 n=1 Tax=Bolinopsis microptera TaxID=2820187 RepID=UPI00307A5084